MTDPQNDWLVIVNPNAGSGKCLREWPFIEKLLVSYGFSFHAVFSTRKLHTILLTRNYINQGYNKLIVIGGDGTINEVVNGIFVQKRFETNEIALGMIPLGTGNDWGRMFGITGNYEESIRIIKEFKTFVQDAGKIIYKRNNQTRHRYFVNISGLGFGAKVVQKANRIKDKGKANPSLYLLNIFTSLLNYKSSRVTFEIDGVSRSFNIFSISVGICKYNGGGMMQLPDAIPDDGLFNVTIIKKIGKIEVIRNIKKLYDGTITKHPKVETFLGKKIRISSPKNIYLESDGESLGHTPAEYEIIPKSIKVISA